MARILLLGVGMSRCFACNRKLGKTPRMVDTHEDQLVQVGSECVKLIEAAGEAGYQPPKGGPRLYLLTPERIEYFKSKGMFVPLNVAQVKL
jgi:hypothetical protein